MTASPATPQASQSQRLKLGKAHKLCSLRAIEGLFGGEGSRASLCYPLRAVWRSRAEQRTGAAPVQIIITVPKKRLRHAVDRVTMRRRVREAYRLNRIALPADLPPTDLAFVYVADRLVDSGRVARAMARLLADVAKSYA